MRHRLCSRVKDDKPQGFTAFDWESLLHGNAGVLGDYKKLAVLPDTIACYLYEFHADSHASLDLPPLPVDRRKSGLNTVGASAVARVNDTVSQRRGFIVGACYP